MRLKHLLSLAFCAAWLGLPLAASATTIAIEPGAPVVGLGDPVTAVISISGLGDSAPESLSIFDIDVSFDPTILSLTSVGFGGQLGLSLASITEGLGSVNLFELSFTSVSDLDTAQPGSFTLATLSFDTLAAGTSSLGLSTIQLGNALGNPIQAVALGSSVDVEVPRDPIPEPTSVVVFLIGSLIVGVAVRRELFT